MSSQHSQPGCCHVWPLGWFAVSQSHCPKSPRHNLMHRPMKKKKKRDNTKGKWMKMTLKSIQRELHEGTVNSWLHELHLPWRQCQGIKYVTISNMSPYDTSGVQGDKIRILQSIYVALRRWSSHELWFIVTVPPSQEDTRTEIVLLLIHSLNNTRRVGFRVHKKSEVLPLVFQSRNKVLNPNEEVILYN